MTIDVSGGAAPSGSTSNESAAPVVKRASDLATLPDAELLQELNLGPAAQAAEVTPTGATDPIKRFVPPADPAGSQAADGEGGVERSETAESRAETAAQAAGAEGNGEPDSQVPAPVERQLQAQFAVFEGDTELEIPDLTIKFKAAGEERDLPLDRVVKLAQQGYYNEQRAEEMRAFREERPIIEQTIAGLQAQNQMLVEGWRRVLSGDEAYLAQEQQEFLAAQSPEARAARLEQELARERGQTREVQFERQAAQFVQGHLVPSLQQIETEHPEVSFEEIVGRFNLLTAPLMVRGQIPPTRFQEVDRLVQTELRPWVDAQNDKRVQAKKQATTTTLRATAEAAAAKRQVARTVMPQGTQATGAQRAAPKKYATAADILDDIPGIIGTPSQ